MKRLVYLSIFLFFTYCSSTSTVQNLNKKQEDLKKINIPSEKCILFQIQTDAIFAPYVLKCDMGDEYCYIRGIRGVSCYPKIKK